MTLKWLPILLLATSISSCSPKGQALTELKLAQQTLRDQSDALVSADTNITQARAALAVGAPIPEIDQLLHQAQAEVTTATAQNTTLVGTTENVIENVAQLKDPEPAWLVGLRYGAIIVGSILLGYILFRFVGPVLGPLLAFVPALIPKPKRDIANIAAKVEAGQLSPDTLVTAIRSDPTAEAVYKKQKRKLDAAGPTQS